MAGISLPASWRYGPIQKLTHDNWTNLATRFSPRQMRREAAGLKLNHLTSDTCALQLVRHIFRAILMHCFTHCFKRNSTKHIANSWQTKQFSQWGNIMLSGMPNTKPYISNNNCTGWLMLTRTPMSCESPMPGYKAVITPHQVPVSAQASPCSDSIQCQHIPCKNHECIV